LTNTRTTADADAENEARILAHSLSRPCISTYVLLREMGSGGYAQAFQAVDVASEQIVCVKLFKEKMLIKREWEKESTFVDSGLEH